MEIQCKETGTWNLDDVSCELAHCNQLPVISHARIQYLAPNGQLSGEEFPVGTKVNFYLQIQHRYYKNKKNIIYTKDFMILY